MPKAEGGSVRAARGEPPLSLRDISPLEGGEGKEEGAPAGPHTIYSGQALVVCGGQVARNDRPARAANPRLPELTGDIGASHLSPRR